MAVPPRASVKKMLSLLKKMHPSSTTQLIHSNPFQLLISTILSAQCTDARVNLVTKDLFKKYNSPRDFAKADIHALERAIHSTGFYHAKARNIKSACKLLVQKFNGKVPKTIEELIELPGVARKTANIVLTNGFGLVEGIAVDTHVMRLSQRLGLTKQKDPNKIEKDLMKILPRSEWGEFNGRLVLHGRYICTARKPKCNECKLNRICPSAFKF
ncbi:G/T mismatches repair enzyme [Candidatus Gugararchaeum adminiculabundum]|nr:G/T mismatches repair enzyme [Candidatus Gugararchaeum adminiculabundum]